MLNKSQPYLPDFDRILYFDQYIGIDLSVNKKKNESDFMSD